MENFISLSLIGFLHQLATITWIGGMTTNLLIVMPVLGKTLDPQTAGKFMNQMMKRFKVLVYVSLIILFFTGFAISGISPDYDTYYDIGREGTNYFLIKHLVILLVIILSVVAFEMVAPAVAKTAAQGPSPKLARLQKTQKALALTGLILALAVVMLSVMLKISH